MKGVFVSYARTDRLLARRLRNALTSLGIEVLWDEDIPSEDWQEFLEQSIDEIPAVVVLWTPASFNSGPVRDEARLGLDKNKLVNILSGVEKPRFPFDRINGLSINGWAAGKPHNGWSRVIATLDARLANAGVISRPNLINESLAAQLAEVERLSYALMQSQKEGVRCARLRDLARQNYSDAEAHLSISEAQLNSLRQIAATRGVMAAALRDGEDARSALAQRRIALSNAENAVDEVEDKFNEIKRSLDEFLLSIGSPRPEEGERLPLAPPTLRAEISDAAPPDTQSTMTAFSSVEPLEEEIARTALSLASETPPAISALATSERIDDPAPEPAWRPLFPADEAFRPNDSKSNHVSRIGFFAWLTVASIACLGLGALFLTTSRNSPQTSMKVLPAEVLLPDNTKATPRDSILLTKKALLENNIAALLETALPPGEVLELKANWTKNLNKDPINDEDRKKFAQQMAALTAVGAEDKLYAEMEPQLKRYNGEGASQIPMMISMGQDYIKKSIQENNDLSDQQKQQSLSFVDAAAKWALPVKFTDPALVKQAIGVFCETARGLNLKMLDEVRSLSYDEAMRRVGILFVGVKRFVLVYGLDLNKWIDSIKVETLENSGDTAKVKITYSIFDKEFGIESEFARVDGKWYNKTTVESWKKQHNLQEAAKSTAAH